jgi:type I restriction enzyme S subunit
MGLMETTATSEEIHRFGLRVDDVLITKDSEEWTDIAVPALVVESAPDLVCGYHLAIIRPQSRRVLGRFLFRAFQSSAINQQFQVAAAGVTRYGLPKSAIGEAWIPMPPLEEQRVVANFLDAQIQKIDTLTAKKRALIEKLEEKRIALISQTVTRGLPPDAARIVGLDPHPTLKPSGIDWLRDVPEHWEAMQLKWAVMFQRGHDLPSDDREEGHVPLVSSSGVSATHSRAAARGPGIVTGRYGTIGQFHLIEEDYWPLNTTLYTVDLRGNDPQFLWYMLTYLSPLFLLNAVKSAVPGVDRNDIHPIRVVVPPVREQRAIANFLAGETAKIQCMAAKVESAMDRLLEYRTSLITATVTGRIDVRGLTEDTESIQVSPEAKLSP